MNRTARLFLILFFGFVLLGLSFIYPALLFLWFLISLLLLLVGMLMLYPGEKVSHDIEGIEKERARLEAAINTLSVGFLLIDADHNLITLNARAQSLLHVIPPLTDDHFYKNLPIITKNFTMQKLEETFEDEIPLKEMIDECILKKKPVEKREVAFGKKIFHVMLSPIVVFKKRPEAIGCVMLIEDATAARVLERSRDEFFSIASHELRTPLTAIRGNVSLIQEYFASTVTDERFKKMLEDVHTSSLRLIHIVDDFLATSRLEQGKIMFKKEAVALDQLLSSLVKEYQPTLKEKGISLSYVSPKTPLSVLGDVDRIKQILINLLGNSIKHTQKGQILVSLTESRGQAEIRIQDTGSGIPEAVQKNLFTKFQRAEQGTYTKDTTSGSGLGLYIAKLLAAGMEGKVTLEKTEVGKGSTFVVQLPVAKTNET